MRRDVVLPWPPSGLSPNARLHWARKAKLAKDYRAECAWQCKAAGLEAPESERISMIVEFMPPDRRRRDDDNMQASFKSGRDGIADALGIDDNRFVVTYPPVTCIGGMVRVILGEYRAIDVLAQPSAKVESDG